MLQAAPHTAPASWHKAAEGQGSAPWTSGVEERYDGDSVGSSGLPHHVDAAVAALLQCVCALAQRDVDGSVREQAVWCLGELGDGVPVLLPRVAVHCLRVCLGDRLGKVRNAAVAALGKWGEGAARLVSFHTPHRHTRGVHVLSHVLSVSSHRPPLLDSLASRLSELVSRGGRVARTSAISTLASFGERGIRELMDIASDGCLGTAVRGGRKLVATIAAAINASFAEM